MLAAGKEPVLLPSPASLSKQFILQPSLHQPVWNFAYYMSLASVTTNFCSTERCNIYCALARQPELQSKIHLNKYSFAKGEAPLLPGQWMQSELHLLCHATKQVQLNKPHKGLRKDAD